MKNQKGQVTIFVIIAIIIVVIGILFFLFFPKIIATGSFNEDAPNLYLETCLETDFNNYLDTMMLQGGTLNPTFFGNYKLEKIQYLCYTSEYFTPCTNQKPLLKLNMEKELTELMQPIVDNCFDSLKESYEKKGYTVSLEKGKINTNINPEEIELIFNDYSLTRTKEDSIEYKTFSFKKNNNLFQILTFVNLIIDEEIKGDVDIIKYMENFNKFKFEFKLLDDGSNIYVLTDKLTKNKFQFAIRSNVLTNDRTYY